MNSIVERLLRKNEDGSLGEITEADQYEAAERIKELEAHYEHWFKEATKARGELSALCQRIKELEAQRDLLHHKSECLNMERKSQDKELAALRQRIADAPVVAWMLYGEAYSVKQRDVFTKIELPNQKALIKQEDLL